LANFKPFQSTTTSDLVSQFAQGGTASKNPNSTLLQILKPKEKWVSRVGLVSHFEIEDFIGYVKGAPRSRVNDHRYGARPNYGNNPKLGISNFQFLVVTIHDATDGCQARKGNEIGDVKNSLKTT
jgi:hypothetical protein